MEKEQLKIGDKVLIQAEVESVKEERLDLKIRSAFGYTLVTLRADQLLPVSAPQPQIIEFLTDLSKATEYKSHPLGFEDVINRRWKEEAEELLIALAARACAPAALTGERLREIAMRHSTPVSGYEFADKFDFDAIAAQLNADYRPESAGRASSELRAREA